MSLRLAALWIVLVAAYAATLGIPTAPGQRYAGDEPRHLRVAESLVDDGDLDVRDELGGSLPAGVKPRPDGAVREAQGYGLGVLAAPAYALGGATGVELFLAAVTALGFVLAALLARQFVPEPWASAGAGLAGLSPPALAAATTVEPWAVGGTLIAGAALCALALRERPRLGPAVAGGALIAVLPWLSPALLVPAAPVALTLALWARGGRGGGALVPLELILGSLVFYVTLNRGLYGGWMPDVLAVRDAPPLPDRLPRGIEIWLDRDAGLLRWAPVLGLAWWATWLLWRSRREGLARALPARRGAEVAAGLAVAVCAGAIVLVVLGPRGLAGAGFPAVPFAAALPAAGALCGWGLRRARRAGAVLGALTLAASAWLLVAREPWSAPPDAPWGPLVAAFPDWGTGSAWELVVTAAVGAAALWILVREWRGREAAAA